MCHVQDIDEMREVVVSVPDMSESVESVESSGTQVNGTDQEVFSQEDEENEEVQEITVPALCENARYTYSVHRSRGSNSNSRTLVVLLGWMGSRDKHLQRYSLLYTNQGYPTLRLTPTQKVRSVLPERLRGVLHAPTSHGLQLFDRFMVHIFSNNGGIAAYQFLKKYGGITLTLEPEKLGNLESANEQQGREKGDRAGEGDTQQSHNNNHNNGWTSRKRRLTATDSLRLSSFWTVVQET